MTRRQCSPDEWLILDRRPGPKQWKALGRLPRGSGVLLVAPIETKSRRRLRHLARTRTLVVVSERHQTTARIHSQRELTQALLRRPGLILISPIHRTRSHPDWTPLHRMRAATLARLAGRRAVALGGMNRQRYATIAALGFIGWAGISAFRT
jgi:thiamine-phosphate pyrophosphorylase